MMIRKTIIKNIAQRNAKVTKIKNARYFISMLFITLFVSACGSSNSDNNQEITETGNTTTLSNVVAVFHPSNGLIPATNDLLFAGSSDGTLNMPVPTDASAGAKQLINTLNTLDGFSTVAPFGFSFNNSINATTLQIGDSIRVYEVDKNSSGAITQVKRELGNADIRILVKGQNSDKIELLPLKPLKESTAYLVVVTNAVKDNDALATRADNAYLLTKSSTVLTGDLAGLEPIRQIVNNQEAIAASQGVNPADIILSWSFTTQSIRPVLENIASNLVSSPIKMLNTGFNTKTANPLLAGKADIYIGALDVPYYLEAPSITNPTAALTSFWKGAGGSFLTRFNSTPISTGTQNIPVMMSVPNANAKNAGVAPATGWPVVIFQHGITRNRTDMLALADSFADAGFVVIAIDLPLHGVVDTNNPFNASTNIAFNNDTERSFNLDLINNTTKADGADGIADESGNYFINLPSPLTSRDNIRQGVADLLLLRKSIPSIDAVALDNSKVGFIGYSLGAIVGTTYLGMESTAMPASIALGGGGIARLLDGSVEFGPVIEAGLAKFGVVKGSKEYDDFMLVTQTALDPADAINYAAQAAINHPIHLMEVVGGNSSLPDQVIPNRVENAPLSGTEPLISVMGLASISQTTASADGAVRFVAGTHASLLDPSSSLQTTIEMQTQLVTFQASASSTIVISDPSVILQQ